MSYYRYKTHQILVIMTMGMVFFYFNSILILVRANLSLFSAS